MTEPTNRKQLKAQAGSAPPEAGVYRIVNGKTGLAMLGSTPNLRSLRNRLEFARSTNSPSALDPRMKTLAESSSLGDLAFEELERLDIPSNATPASIQADLATLEQLWREKLGL